MGRYINGDIDHKFWFGVQSSAAASQFGGEVETSDIPYEYYSMDCFNVQVLDKLISKVNKIFNTKITRATDPEWFWEKSEKEGETRTRVGYWWEDPTLKEHLEDMADVQLGLKIYQKILENGECYFVAET